VVGFVIDDEDIPPIVEHPLDDGVRVLLGTAAHGAQDGGGNEAAFLHDVIADPVIPLGFEGDRLPVLDHDVRLELLKVLGGNDVELLVEVVLATRVYAVPTGSAADAVPHGEVGDNNEEIIRER
jgi:hypothetical protein